ncbi:hypothetical protein TorRG33x02_016820 [Trema orientale]|uniref:Uncharacterized protein n=1 Tax=Trema orientale TaxID=63057 RepID=A0A2P5FY28_TREOI|nr:hypothetical protein TorRG33x02_016820 [Trema orientale]
MLSLRSRQNPQTPLDPSHSNDEQTQTQKNETISDYEQTREERIKQNLEKMHKLGIFDLSLKLKSNNIHESRAPKSQSRVRTPPSTPPLKPSGPIRRSSRLKNSTVSYSEVDLVTKDKALGDEDILLEVGSRPEIYTEEHEKLLGNTEKTWTLFVDGYGKDGKRIYDPVRGKTCHQCRSGC